MNYRRKVHIAFVGQTEILITTPLFQKIFNLSNKDIEAIDLIGVKSFTCSAKARRKSDFIAEIKYSKEYNNFSIEVRIYAKINNNGGLSHIEDFEREDKERLVEVNIIPDEDKVYFHYLENIDDCI